MRSIGEIQINKFLSVVSEPPYSYIYGSDKVVSDWYNLKLNLADLYLDSYSVLTGK